MIKKIKNVYFSPKNTQPISTIDGTIKKINTSCKRKFEELENPNKDENKEPLLKKRKITKKNTTTDTKNKISPKTKPKIVHTLVSLLLLKKIFLSKKNTPNS